MIAELDGAYTRYCEATLESEWRGDKTFVRGSYTWSHYYGNFDQDNSTTANDANIFIGSSNIADGAGRQLWNFKDGDLRGDRPHLLKVYGYRQLDWNATVGRLLRRPVRAAVGDLELRAVPRLTTSTSDTNRYAEPAGSRRSDAHWQLDLNYTQNFKLGGRYTLQIAGDLFNVFNKQTGYDIEPSLPQLDLRESQALLRPAAVPGGRPLPVLTLRGPGGASGPPALRTPSTGTAAPARSAPGWSRRPAGARARSAPPGRARRAARSPGPA